MFETKEELVYTDLGHIKDGIADLAAGTFSLMNCFKGGVVNVIAGQPLDTVKVKLQTFPNLYRTGISCMKKTVKVDGIRGLYAGTVPALVANVAENAILFTAYGYCKKLVAFCVGRSSLEQMTPVENAVSGSLASVFAAMALCPTELVKCKLQAKREMFPEAKSTPFSISREIYRTHGLRGFYTGMVATLCREMPGYFAFFGAYELSRFYFTPKGKSKDDIGILRTAISGGIGGVGLWFLIYPVDVVKSRTQIAGSGSFTRMLTKIIRKEGIRAVYKGLTFTLIRAFWATACLFVSYENSKLLFKSWLS
ncbi:unnamed protein product [Thelazia callipaeda]|uniref:Mitochondrial ornithine transporter 1 n=1 Tax=Thelazia callipaeda TaxID=103827 RepID=A0A0N5DBG9_THECL|nr:unnamed protein product [Thelazia callipaeda]